MRLRHTSSRVLFPAFACLALLLSCSEDTPGSHTHNGSDIDSGEISNSRLRMGPGGGLDADTVDGSHAAAFALSAHLHDGVYAGAAHDHDASYLRLTGGSLSGALTVPANGFSAGTSQLVLSGGFVGIGTASPSARLEVAGNLLAIATTGHGIRGQTSDASAAGVYGNSSAGHGLEGISSGSNKSGAYGSSSGGHGVHGVSSSASHAGVYGTSSVGDAVWGQCTGGGSGVVGTTTDANFAGVNGQSTAGLGVYGESTASNMSGVYGKSSQGHGIVGETTNSNFAGVRGYSQVGDGVAGMTQATATNWGGNFQGDLGVNGNILKTGIVSFVERNPDDPARAIVYVCLEAGEVGTYCRGKARLAGGSATVELPRHFTLVSSREGITVQATPAGPCKGLYVESYDSSRIVVRELMDGTSDVEFHYTVNGVRKGYEKYDPDTDSAKVLRKLDEAEKGK